MSTDHTCNGGCSRCVKELDITYWIDQHNLIQNKADQYRELLTRIITAIPETPTVQWGGHAMIQSTAPRQFLDAVHNARTMINDEHS